jgi:hypothetical protein
MKRFRINKDNTVLGTVSSLGTHNDHLLASVYDSGFTTINQIISTLNRKIAFYGGNKLSYRIAIPEKELVKYIIKKVN